MKVVTTIPPYAPYLADIADHPIISGGRLNTVMPVKEPVAEMLQRVNGKMKGKELWIDLKCRQLRTSHGFFFNEPAHMQAYRIKGETVVLDPTTPKAYGIVRTPPWAMLKLDRKIKLDLTHGPVRCWFQDGYDTAQIVEIIDGDNLIMLDGPERVVGGGESINILDPSLEIEGYLTDRDLEYIEAAKKVGVHRYMLSYVEQESDITDLLALDPDAQIIAKIESVKGLNWVRDIYPRYPQITLMAARGDLYVEVGIKRPDKIIPALRRIVNADPRAIAASRILTSLRDNARPTCPDITDIACLLEMGYQNLMIGDDICFNQEMLLLSLDILQAIGVYYEPAKPRPSPHPPASPSPS